MKFNLVLLFLTTMLTGANAQIETYDNLLKNHVTPDGVVDYKEIKNNADHLQKYIDYLVETSPSKDWSSARKKAFWINAYNAYTLKIIIENYPVSSILKIKKGGKDAWNQDFAIVGGDKYTLNHIEHEILRKDFSDPRIHVGVNCASFSCPPLANFAFTEENVEASLEVLMKKFINDPQRNVITEKKLKLSKIFEWFQEDFTKSQSLLDYVKKYSDVSVHKKAKIRFAEYNWNLNE